MTSCQSSPVEHRISRRKEVQKSLKFACSFSSTLGAPILVKLNKDRPMIAKMKKIMIKRSPREPSEGAESIRVIKMICSRFKRLRSLRILPMRKARRTVAPLPKEIGSYSALRKRIESVRITMIKSKTFQESLK